LLGPLYNFVRQPGASPLEWSHREGLVFVAMDALEYASFPGGRLLNEWVVARDLHGDLPLDGWPDVGFRFSDEGQARQAYQHLRNHVMSRLSGVQPRDDRSQERRLNDPASAWSEAFHWRGGDALHLFVDRITEARMLEMMTDRLEAFSLSGGQGPHGAVYNSQTAPHVIGIATGEGGLVEHAIVAFVPGGDFPVVSAGMPGSDCDTEPFDLEIPTGLLVLAWARMDGAAMLSRPGVHPAQVLSEMIGNQVASPLATPFDAAAPGPLAWGIRVRPGRYRVALRFSETEHGVSAMALSNAAVAPLWPDMAAAPMHLASAAPYGAGPGAHAMGSPGGAGSEDDPVVFPGGPVPRLSEYVRITKRLQAGDFQGALAGAGIDMATYGQVAAAWGQRMAADPALTAKYVAMISRP
jgi:hypothetical protein